MPIGPLPDLNTLDVAALKDMVIRQHAQISSHDAVIERLRLIVARLRGLQFGRKSEKIQKEIEQLELQLEDLEAASADQREQTEKTLAPAAAAVFGEAVRKPARRPLPDHLPREVEIHEPEQKGCPACGGSLSQLGQDVSEMLEYVPARFKVIRHVRPKLSCTKCDAIVQGEAPSRPVARGLAGPGLLAHVLVSKYADHRVPRTHFQYWKGGAVWWSLRDKQERRPEDRLMRHPARRRRESGSGSYTERGNLSL